jgi:hypothetical protein
LQLRLSSKGREARLRVQGNFLSHINLMLAVQSPLAKIFRFSLDPNHPHISRRLIPQRGAYRDRHGRWDEMRWTRQRRARDVTAGRVGERPVSDRRRADERCCFRLRENFDGGAHSGGALGEDGSRTVKPCGPGTRCWCQIGGGFIGPTGSGRIANSPMTVTRRIRRRGERGVNR